MADYTKQYLDYAGLTEVVTQVKTLIADSEFSGKAADVTVEDVAGLLTATNVEDALAEILGVTGKLTDLETDAKTSLVAAINEIKDAIDDVDFSGKADKVDGATAGNFAGLDENGNLVDSGKKAADFDAAGAAAAVSGYAEGETAKTVKEVVESLGTAAAKDVATKAIEAEGETADDKANVPTVGQIETYVTSKIAGLTGAVHFRGIVTSLDDITDPASGDMAIVGVKEYIYNGTEWQELGDEGAYVTKEDGKSLVANTDIEKLQAIAVSEADGVVSVTDGTNTLKISAIPLTGENSIAKLFE